MGGRGASSASARTGKRKVATQKSRAQTVAEQIDPKLTAKFLKVVNNNDFYHTYTAEEAVQNIIDLWVPASYFEKNLADEKKNISKAKRTINNKRTSSSARERAQIRLKSAQESATMAEYNLAAAKLLGM